MQCRVSRSVTFSQKGDIQTPLSRPKSTRMRVGRRALDMSINHWQLQASSAKYRAAVDGECAKKKTNHCIVNEDFGSPKDTGVLGTGHDIAGMKSGPRSGVSPISRQLQLSRKRSTSSLLGRVILSLRHTRTLLPRYVMF